MEKYSNQELLEILKTEKLTKKYLAIFQLKQNDSVESARALIQGFPFLQDSSLLQHEVTYALGQMKQSENREVIDFLIACIRDEKNYVVVRHEAAEGLSNYSLNASLREELLALFKEYENDASMELSVTCKLAIKKVETFEQLGKSYGLKYSETKEPAAPFSVEEFKQKLNSDKPLKAEDIIEFVKNPDNHLFDKYRCMYLLREIIERDRSEQTCLQLCELLNKQQNPDINGLLKHEVCFVLGQVSQYGKLCEPQLIQTITDESENEIVRHEAISAFSSISENKEFLQSLFNDKSQIVRESAIVAHDLIDYWNN